MLLNRELSLLLGIDSCLEVSKSELFDFSEKLERFLGFIPLESGYGAKMLGDGLGGYILACVSFLVSSLLLAP